jgi:hypothetical protein
MQCTSKHLPAGIGAAPSGAAGKAEGCFKASYRSVLPPDMTLYYTGKGFIFQPFFQCSKTDEEFPEQTNRLPPGSIRLAAIRIISLGNNIS